jgi:hypothetical protein
MTEIVDAVPSLSPLLSLPTVKANITQGLEDLPLLSFKR